MSDSEEQSQGPVIRDRRRIDPITGQSREPAASATSAQAGPAVRGAGQSRPGKHAVSKPGSFRPEAAGAAGQSENAGPGSAGTAGGSGVPGAAEPSASGDDATAGAAAPADPNVAVMLAERTADLQRLQAEYANYRKRVERDRMAVREHALAAVLVELLPVLDDIGRAREHGELTGGFKSVAESLEATATKLGLTTYGETGEPFDPNIHEALMHSYSPDVTETTCVQILQPGYKVGERIMRPARVAVAEPADPAGARTTSDPISDGVADADPASTAGSADGGDPAGATDPDSPGDPGSATNHPGGTGDPASSTGDHIPPGTD